MAAAPPEQALAALKALKFWHGEKALEALQVPILAINAQARFTDAKALQERGVGVVRMRDAGHFLMLEAPKTFDKLLQTALKAFGLRPHS
jgi:pimeloyl-ACP methyl ester carboxylesterase